MCVLLLPNMLSIHSDESMRSTVVIRITYAIFLLLLVTILALAIARLSAAVFVPEWKLGITGMIMVGLFLILGGGGMVLLSQPRIRGWVARNAPNILLSQVSFLVTTVIVEVALRMILPHTPPFLKQDDLMGWVPRAGVSGTVGARFGQPPYHLFVDVNGFVDGIAGEGRRLVLLLGDSMLWPYYSPDYSAPAVFARECLGKCRVVNASVTGYGTDQQLLWLKRSLTVQPGVTDVAFFFLPINNYGKNYAYRVNFMGLGGIRKPRFEVRGNGENLVLVQPVVRSGDIFDPAWPYSWGYYRAWSLLRDRIFEPMFVAGESDVPAKHRFDDLDMFYQLYQNEPSQAFRETQKLTVSLIAEIAAECRKKDVGLHAFVFDSPTELRNGGLNAFERNVQATFDDAKVRFQWIRFEEDDLIPSDIHPNRQGLRKIAHIVMQSLLRTWEDTESH